MPLTTVQKIRSRLVAITILCIAVTLIFLLSFNWSTLAGDRLVRLRERAPGCSTAAGADGHQRRQGRDLRRAARLESSRTELEVQRRRRFVFDTQEQLLRADLKARQAALVPVRTNWAIRGSRESVHWCTGRHKVERTKRMLQVATEVVKLRAEADRIAENQLANGVILISDRRQVSAATYKAQAYLL